MPCSIWWFFKPPYPSCPAGHEDEIETRSDPKHRGKEGLFEGSKQETGGDADADTEQSILPRREGRLSLCGS